VAVTLTPVTTYPLPGSVAIDVATTGGGDFARLWITDAPPDSALKKQLTKSGAGRIELATVDNGKRYTLEADIGGGYVFAAQEYTKGASTYGGGYQGDPNSYTTETKVGSESAVTVYVGERMTHRLGCATRGFATLVVYVFDGTIRETTAPVHGEATPSVVDPTTVAAKTAANDATLVASVAALVDVAASALMPNLGTLVNEMITDIPAHMNNTGGSFHTAPDTDNDTAIENLPGTPGTPDSLAHSARVIMERLTLHQTNGVDNSDSHHDKTKGPDYENAIIAPRPGSAAGMPAVLGAVADIYRAYEAHRQDSDYHQANDTTNTLATTFDPLLVIHRDFLEAFLPLSPTAPANLNPGAVRLGQYGFNKAQLPTRTRRLVKA
jgi:hypothetical protein